MRFAEGAGRERKQNGLGFLEAEKTVQSKKSLTSCGSKKGCGLTAREISQIFLEFSCSDGDIPAYASVAHSRRFSA